MDPQWYLGEIYWVLNNHVPCGLGCWPVFPSGWQVIFLASSVFIVGLVGHLPMRQVV